MISPLDKKVKRLRRFSLFLGTNLLFHSPDKRARYGSLGGSRLGITATGTFTICGFVDLPASRVSYLYDLLQHQIHRCPKRSTGLPAYKEQLFFSSLLIHLFSTNSSFSSEK